jgi:hypothetical protein
MATADPVNTIAESLKETDELPKKQIAEIVEVLGPDASLAILAETRRVQDEGGVAVRDGTRRRTDGGVFFSLAKVQLPKADRNRIFRIRPPKSPESERAAEAAGGTNGSPAPPRPQAPPERARPEGFETAAAQQQQVGGRRRVVEVEVLRSFPKPPAPGSVGSVGSVDTQARPAGISRSVPAEPARSQQELRPLRRIVTVAPVREEPPATPEAARDRVRGLLKGLAPADQKRVLAELGREFGAFPESAPKRVVRQGLPVSEPSSGVDDATRERVLAAVTDALGLSTEDLALVLYGDDSPSTKSKARGALDRWRKG